MNYLVHVGCHLVTTCLPRHWINGRGRDRRMNIGGRRRYGHIRADGREHVGHEHVERKHVPGANMLGANMYQALTCRVPTCTGRKHVGRQLKGANLTLFFSKNIPKLPFLAEEAQMNFILFFCTFNCRIFP
jgi:hypothetical protein